MPVKLPSLCHFKPRNLACVWVSPTRRIYLGPWGSPESHERYAELIRRLLAGDEVTEAPTLDKPTKPPCLTMSKLAERYLVHARRYYSRDGKPTTECGKVESAVNRAVTVYGALPAEEFGPLCLEDIRDRMIAEGLARTVEVGQWIEGRDPSRLVNIASGGNFWPVGDIVDRHAYPAPEFPLDKSRFNDFVKVVGEFGGHGYAVKGHLWIDSSRNWGYGGLPKDKAEYKQRYVDTTVRVNELRARGVAGGVYTQTTDVEGEVNGLMTYDRKVIKIPAEELAEIHRQLFE